MIVEEVTEESLQTETVLSLFGLPDVSRDSLEDEAKRIHAVLTARIPTNNKHRYWFPVIKIKEKYNVDKIIVPMTAKDTIATLLEQMADSDADIVKIALMPQNAEDVLCLLEQTNAFHEKYPNQPLITMSMGKLGVISRISGEVFGSCVTFGAGKVSSAPGQIPMLKLQEILDTIHG